MPCLVPICAVIVFAAYFAVHLTVVEMRFMANTVISLAKTSEIAPGFKVY